MPADRSPILLGSRSPRRRELLSLLIGAERVMLRPPATTEEPGYEGLSSWAEIEARTLDIVRHKQREVEATFDASELARLPLLTADTVIVVNDAAGRLQVLGQPPPGREEQAAVRQWFQEFYLGKTHVALSAVRLIREGQSAERLVQTRVTFGADRSGWLDWYLASGEPAGKAGGYALQGLASVFITKVEGSLSNVVWLPVAETRELLLEFGLVEG